MTTNDKLSCPFQNILMENTTIHRTRLLLLAIAIVFGMSVSSIASVRADGTLLAGFDVPALVPCCNGNSALPALYWPIGIAFNGNNLWYSQPCTCTSDIFLTSTSGVLLNTLKEVKEAGALAWDGSHLWVGSFPFRVTTCTAGQTGCAFLTEVDVTTGNPIGTIDVSAVFAPDQECGFIDGLDYDASNGSFWVSPDLGCLIGIVPDVCAVGYVYNVDGSGNLLKRLQLPFGVAGISRVGSNLYMVSCSTPGHQRPIIKTTLDGTVVSSFFTVSASGHRESAEDLAFDPVTFAPRCALWAVQDYGFPFDGSLAAYQIACP